MNLDVLNAAGAQDFVRMLDGTYEHSPWIAERAAAARPFTSLAALKHGSRRSFARPAARSSWP